MSETAFQELIAPYGNQIAIDIGTGDGLFVYRSAAKDPSKFFIGIDTNVKPLQPISQKIARKNSRGGIPNALYLRASVQDLPDELTGLAQTIFVNFPWGSLLGAMLGSVPGLTELRKICRTEGQLESILSFDPDKDRAEFLRLGIQLESFPSVATALTELYFNAGWHLHAEQCQRPENLRTTWGQKLQINRERMFVRIVARPIQRSSSSPVCPTKQSNGPVQP